MMCVQRSYSGDALSARGCSPQQYIIFPSINRNRWEILKKEEGGRKKKKNIRCRIDDAWNILTSSSKAAGIFYGSLIKNIKYLTISSVVLCGMEKERRYEIRICSSFFLSKRGWYNVRIIFIGIINNQVLTTSFRWISTSFNVMIFISFLLSFIHFLWSYIPPTVEY